METTIFPVLVFSVVALIASIATLVVTVWARQDVLSAISLLRAGSEQPRGDKRRDTECHGQKEKLQRDKDAADLSELRWRLSSFPRRSNSAQSSP